MQVGTYRTTLGAARLFKVCRAGMMPNRGMQTRPDGESVNCSNKLSDNERGHPELSHTSQVAYNDEFPSLSAYATSSKPNAKRRASLDLKDSTEKKSKEVENVARTPMEMSTSINHQKDTILCVKKHSSRNPELSPKHQGDGQLKRSSMSSPGNRIDEPFDICLPDTKQSISPGNSVNEKIWRKEKEISEMQSAEENEKLIADLQKNSDMEDSVAEGSVLRPGMVLFKQYISLPEQINIVKTCRQLGCGRGGFYRPGYNDGAKLRLYMMCLGLDWNPQTKSYGETRYHDKVAPPAIPHEFTSLVTRVLSDSHALIKRELKTMNPETELPAISPDVCIVNFYTTTGRLGLHQDRDESVDSLQKGLPVVSVSVGDSAEFLYGDERDIAKAGCVKLESGDVLIFGGDSRHIFHGVKTIIPDTAPPALREITNLRPGRLNLTFRKY